MRAGRRLADSPFGRRSFWLKLVLPFTLLLLALSLPFLLIPEDVVERGIVRAPSAPGPASPPGGGATPPPFQQWMQLGMAFLLIPVLAGGYLLYTITRHQSRLWARRSGRGRKREGGETPPPAAGGPAGEGRGKG